MRSYTLQPMRTHFPTVASILLLVCSQSLFASPEPELIAQSDPGQSLQTMVNQISAFQRSSSDSLAKRRFVEQEIVPRFAFSTMAHWIAGPYARYMSPEDKTVFAVQLKKNLSGFFIRHLDKFHPDTTTIEIFRTRFSRGDEATVVMRIVFQQRHPLLLSFRMQRLKHEWKIVDIRSNGASLTMYFRAHYIRQLRSFRQ